MNLLPKQVTFSNQMKFRERFSIAYHNGENGDDKSRNGYGHLFIREKVLGTNYNMICLSNLQKKKRKKKRDCVLPK